MTALATLFGYLCGPYEVEQCVLSTGDRLSVQEAQLGQVNHARPLFAGCMIAFMQMCRTGGYARPKNVCCEIFVGHLAGPQLQRTQWREWK